MARKKLFRIQFLNQGKVYLLHARRVTQGDLYGFVQVEELVFDDGQSVVIDPSEERLKAEFDGVRTLHLPLHAVIRIDEVERPGSSKITEASTEGNVISYPFTPPKK
jgi:hypothetical protein